MAEIKEMKTEDIVKDIYNSLIEALLATLEANGSLKETIIEAKHLTQDINAVAKGFNADQVDGLHASDLANTSRARAYQTNTFALPSGVWTKITLDTENFDGLGEFTNSRFTATTEGYYLCTGCLGSASGLSDLTTIAVSIHKNGSSAQSNARRASGSGSKFIQTSSVIYLNIGDYVELYGYQNEGVARNTFTGTERTSLAIHKLSTP